MFGELGIFRSRKMATLAALGFSTAIPYFLLVQALVGWFTDAGVSLEMVGALSAVGLPYTFKWAWAPLIDRYPARWLGRRKGWIVGLQLAVALAIAGFAGLEAAAYPVTVAGYAIVVAVLASSLEVVTEAYLTESLEVRERAAGAAVYSIGYRTVRLLGGSLPLLLVGLLRWPLIFLTMAAISAAGLFVSTGMAEPPSPPYEPRPLVRALFVPVWSLVRRPGIATALVIVATYKLGDQLLTQMLVPFLNRSTGFSLPEIAVLNKSIGFAAAFAGGLTAGPLVARMGVRASLISLGLLQASTNIGYCVLAEVGKSYPLLCAVVCLDNVSGAMATSAFFAFLMSLCDRRFSATQFAALTSLGSIGSRVVAAWSGYLALRLGWPGFFAVTAALGMPALALVLCLARDDRWQAETSTTTIPGDLETPEPGPA